MSKDSCKTKYFKELNSLRFIGFIGIFFGHIFFSNSPEIINSKLYATLFSYRKILGFKLNFKEKILLYSAIETSPISVKAYSISTPLILIPIPKFG